MSAAKPVKINTVEGFTCGAIAACLAVRTPTALLPSSSSTVFPQVTVSNPAEVAKTRLQLQGELAKDGGVKVYTNAVDVLSKTFKNEGIRGVQRGLAPAVCLGTFRACHDVDPSA